MGQLAAELLLDKETPDNEPGSSHWSLAPPLPVLGVTTGLQPPVSSSSARAAGGAAAASVAVRGPSHQLPRPPPPPLRLPASPQRSHAEKE